MAMKNKFDLSRVDISGHWRPNTVGMSLYGEAKTKLRQSIKGSKPAHFAVVHDLYMGFIENSCTVADAAIYNMMSYDVED